jgi:glycosyltransferase involved in cell wall biosynthesis
MIFILDLPGPVHGMSVVNKKMCDLVDPDYIVDTAPILFDKIPFSVGKFLAFFYAYIRYLFVLFRSKQDIYRPINGGVGQIYDVAIFWVAKILRVGVYVHHHSFAYINKKSFLFNLINKLVPQARHIVLGESMKKQLCLQYKIDPKMVSVISNSAILGLDVFCEDNFSNSEISIGYLANISFEKGFSQFLSLCKKISEIDAKFNFHLGGGFASNAERVFFENFCKENPGLINYVGPVYGSAKVEFYKKLNVFVFPSFYTNEAEPLVLYEAASSGAFIVGTQQGCMADVIECLKGCSFPADDNVIDCMTNEILRAAHDGTLSKDGAQDRVSALMDFINESEIFLSTLIKELKS